MPQAKAQDDVSWPLGDTGSSPLVQTVGGDTGQLLSPGSCSNDTGATVCFDDETLTTQTLQSDLGDELLAKLDEPWSFAKGHFGEFAAVVGALAAIGAVRHFANKYRAPLQDLLGKIPGHDKHSIVQLKNRIDKSTDWERFFMLAAAVGAASSFEECRDFVVQNRADVILFGGALAVVYAVRRILNGRKNVIMADLRAIEKELKAPVSPERKIELEKQRKELTATRNIWTAADVSLLGGVFVTALSKSGYMDKILEWISHNDMKLLGVGIVLGGGYYVYRELNKSITSLSPNAATSGASSEELSPLADFLLKGTRVLVGGTAGAISLGIAGVPIGQVFNSLGLFSMAVSFATKDMMSNWVARQIIRLQEFIKEGEERIISGMRGIITDMNWQNTAILEETPYGTLAEQRIPNTDLLAKTAGKPIGDKTLIDQLKIGDYVRQQTAKGNVDGRVWKINKERGTFVVQSRDMTSPRPDAYVNTVLYLSDLTPVSHTNYGAGKIPLDADDPDLDVGDLIEVSEVTGIIDKYDDDYVWLYPEDGEYVRLKRTDLKGKIKLISRRKMASGAAPA